MKTIYVIKEVEKHGGYFISKESGFTDEFKEATEYSSYEKACNTIATKCPNGKYQIEEIIIKG